MKGHSLTHGLGPGAAKFDLNVRGTWSHWRLLSHQQANHEQNIQSSHTSRPCKDKLEISHRRPRTSQLALGLFSPRSSPGSPELSAGLPSHTPQPWTVELLLQPRYTDVTSPRQTLALLDSCDWHCAKMKLSTLKFRRELGEACTEARPWLQTAFIGLPKHHNRRGRNAMISIFYFQPTAIQAALSHDALLSQMETRGLLSPPSAARSRGFSVIFFFWITEPDQPIISSLWPLTKALSWWRTSAQRSLPKGFSPKSLVRITPGP